MFPSREFWKKFYLIVIPFAAIVIFRDAFVDFFFYRRAGSFRITFQYNLLVWVLWLALAPVILWLFRRILALPKLSRIPLVALLVIGSSAIHQLVHHWIFLSTLEFLRLAWGTLMVSMFLGFVYAVKLQNERRRAEIHATKIEKQIEEARLLHIRTQMDPGSLLAKLRRAKETIQVDAEKADLQLTDLAEDLRATLKSFAGKLQSFCPVTPASGEPKPRRLMWLLLMSCASMIVGIWITDARVLDDLYVWHYITLPWDAYWNLWLSWFGVALLTPFIFWMSRRFSPGKYFVFHVAACILFFCVINIGLQMKAKKIPELRELLPVTLSTGLAWGFKFDVYGAVLIAAVTLNRLESKRQEDLRVARSETLLVSAQLEALKMQLHPHFLFNALNSIIELIHQNKKQAAELLERLEQLLEMTLQVQDVQDVPLRKELEFVRCYLDMQKVRFPKRLSITWDIEEGSMESRVPTLILQPLVENAIRHGIAQNARQGEISIESKRCEQSLHLRIRDTGPGLSSKNVQEGIGLLNTKHRLKQMYGDQFRFEMENEVSGGLIVSLEIPCH